MKNVYIIFNPNSTGDSKQNAKDFKHRLEKAGVPAKLLATEYAGHAVKLAREYAAKDVMIISSSGDGGYNEVINGVLTSKHPETVIGVLPSGNANDHYNAQHHGSTTKRIKARDIDELDILKITYGKKVRYAHSYAGLGLSADVGDELTKSRPNRFSEIWLVIISFFKLKSVKIIINGRKQRYDSLVCSVITRMAKYLHLGDDRSRPKGEFTIIHRRAGSTVSLIRHFLHLSVQQADDAPTAKKISFQTVKKTSLQVDGEIIDIPAKTNVTIECESSKLRSIV